MKIHNLLCSFFVAVFVFLLAASSSQAQALSDLQWGETVNGLQMSISPAEPGKNGVPAFYVVIRNAGEKDTAVNLGIMLGNGNVQDPDRIRFNVTDAGGKTYQLSFGAVMLVAGRLDDYIVPLRAGSAYMLKLSSEHINPREPQMTVSKIFSGKYTISAVFEGTSSGDKLYTRSISIMNFWTGKLESNVLTVN